MSTNSKRTIYVGGLAEEVDEKVLNAAFIPFGDIIDIQIPIDYETEKHRGFAFIEFECAEDAAAAIDNMVRSKFKPTSSNYQYVCRMIPNYLAEPFV